MYLSSFLAWLFKIFYAVLCCSYFKLCEHQPRYRVSTLNIHKLQRCQNTAARLILQQSFTPSIQDLMNQLHWLPIQARIDFKITTLTYKALSSGQPAYLRELIAPYKPSRQLRSSDQSLLTIPRTNLTIGQRAFSQSSVFIWNSIPLAVRNAPTISTFKRRLKHSTSLLPGGPN